MFCPVCETKFEGTVCPVCGTSAMRNYEAAVRCVLDDGYGYASAALLQRRLKIGYMEASRLIDEMELNGIIGPYREGQPRKVLIPYKDLSRADEKPIITPKPMEKGTEYLPSGVNVFSCDMMNGHDFEYLCAEILKANGYENVTVTKASGDQGIDILADKSGSRYAIQCKCYTAPIGNHAVQEAFSGAAFYDGRIPVVMTNQTFTASARELASKNKVILWDRGELERMISVYNGTPRGTVIYNHVNQAVYSGKLCNKWISFFLCLFFGYLGAHKFYERKTGIGFLYLFTLGIFGLGWIIDIVLILKKPNPYFVN